MTFHVGQKVVCVGMGPKYRGNPILRDSPYNGIKIGGVYTIRSLNVWSLSLTIVCLHEVDNSHLIGVGGGTIEPGWDIRGFRPLIERKTDSGVAILKKIARDVTERKKIGEGV